MEEKKEQSRRIPISLVNVEFLKIKDFVGKMIEEGHSINYIYGVMKENNNIQMGYHSLLNQTKKYFPLNFPKNKTKVNKNEPQE